MRRPLLVLFVLLACLDGAPLAGQTVPSRPIVSGDGRAALRLREVVRVGSMDGAHDAFGRVMDAALDSRGRIVVADDLGHRVVVFAPDGRYVGTLGRHGRGPGEFESPWKIAIDAADSIFVWDMALARISVFAPDLSFARTFPVPPQWTVNSLGFLPDGRLLIAAYARELPGALHMVSRTGRLERSFGPRFAADLGGFESSLLGGTADVSSGLIAYSVKSPYEIRFFDLAGRARGRCVGSPEWTTEPASVLDVREAGTRLHWRRYVHSSRVVGIGGGLLMNQVLDPSGEHTFVDLLDSDCRLLGRTVISPPTIIASASGGRLVGVRKGDFHEVVVFEQRIERN
jgi:hypothetical protein